MLIQSFQKSPYSMGLADYPFIPFVASLWNLDQVWIRLTLKGILGESARPIKQGLFSKL